VQPSLAPPAAPRTSEFELSGFDVGVAEQFLDGADVFSGFEQMGGEGVAEGVGGNSFFDAGFTEGTLKSVGVGAGVEMMAADDA
jgi:hypothetical protein